MEAAPRWDVHRARDLPGGHDLLRLEALLLFGDDRDGREEHLGVGVPGRLEEGPGGGDLADLAQVHDGHPLGHVAHQAQVVGDEEVGEIELPLQAQEQVDHFALHRDVQGRGGLVQQDHRRVRGQGPGHGHDLPLPAAQGPGVFVEIVQGQLHHFQEPGHLFQAVAHLRPVDAQGQLQDLLHCVPRVQRGSWILEDDLDLLLELLGALAVLEDALAPVLDAAGGGGVHAHGGVGHGALARARLPHQAHRLPLVDGQGDPVHRLDRDGLASAQVLVADDEVLFQIPVLENGVHGGRTGRLHRVEAAWAWPCLWASS